MGRRKDRDDDNESEEEDNKVETKDRKSRSKSKSRKDKKRSRRDDDDDDDDDNVKESDDRSDDDDDDDDSEDTRERRRRRKKDRRRKKKDNKKKRKRSRSKKRSRREESDDSDGSDDSDDDSGSGDDSEEERQRKSSSKKKSKKDKNKTVVNKRLLEKLEARGETLEEREARRAQRRAARITAKFGYTADDNPFNDPNIHETFTWKKKGGETKSRQNKQDEIFGEIEKVRQRRKDRELEFEEMQRIRAEESRMRELENYDEWARKEEEFHLLQQRQRSAIRLVEGREKPIDVLAKNMLMFGLSADEMENRAKVKYQEKYNALSELENLEAELEEPHQFLKVLKLNELEELLEDIDAFRSLEREALGGGGGLSLGNQDSPVLRYWDNIHLVASDEIKYLRNGGAEGARATTLADVQKLFKGQSKSELVTMRGEVEDRLRKSAHSAAFNGTGAGTDMDYWRTVLEQLDVYLARSELSELHCKMLARQLERLERRKEQLEAAPSGKDKDGSAGKDGEGKSTDAESAYNAANESMRPKDAPEELKNLDEELGLSDELDLGGKTYAWQDKYRPRKPRYFNRVKTGYDWNKYNQTHYDHDNPPPKTVQGYKFNVFYPDLIDRTKTPKFFLEKADTDEFCVIRFHAGPPYEDVAFKIINREWKRSRKHGFRCTFERGVLSLYFNFKTHWYRR